MRASWLRLIADKTEVMLVEGTGRLRAGYTNLFQWGCMYISCYRSVQFGVLSAPLLILNDQVGAGVKTDILSPFLARWLLLLLSEANLITSSIPLSSSD